MRTYLPMEAIRCDFATSDPTFPSRRPARSRAPLFLSSVWAEKKLLSWFEVQTSLSKSFRNLIPNPHSGIAVTPHENMFGLIKINLVDDGGKKGEYDEDTSESLFLRAVNDAPVFSFEEGDILLFEQNKRLVYNRPTRCSCMISLKIPTSWC